MMNLEITGGGDKHVRANLTMSGSSNGELLLTYEELVVLANKLFGRKFFITQKLEEKIGEKTPKDSSKEPSAEELKALIG